jgi:class 3 adenylate cyclase
MPSERVQRQIDRLLDEAEQRIAEQHWSDVRDLAQHVLTIDPENADGREFLAMAERGLTTRTAPHRGSDVAAHAQPAALLPASFAAGRYQVHKLLGEGGKKRVYRAHDALLDREVAFALIKTDGLDDAGRERVRREARAMGRLGSHPNIVSVLDLGEERGQPYLVTELMHGGDLATLVAGKPDHRLPIEEVVSLGQQLSRALEHAHAREVIHRDLKPGNIWMSQDGTAKLGDFGLAVALDQTRHTRPGLMIGTVSYMAPEQAIGGNVDARSDLYSLGCVLYELVCGRPPFIGDESVAIITQHLNTPPVMPSWHRPETPPALETLLLQLLEKDAAKRPPSAGVVRAALAAIDLARLEPVNLPSSEPVQQGSPLYQQTFVGRENELRQMQAAYDAALSGHGGLLMVVGEPGIGKTALCEQLATYTAVRGGSTLVGHCYEEGSLSLPYLPFVEALRSYVAERETDSLERELGAGAGDVARIVSEIRDRVHIAPGPDVVDPEEQRWRLMQAVSGFLRNAANVDGGGGLVLVLEDLHWADRGTLDLLLHLSRNLSGSRLLVVGTYRDVEVDRAHPLSSALAELRRGSAFVRVALRGLTVDQVHRMMCQIRGQDVPWSRAEAIHRQTEGNPLFVQEVLRYIVEEGILVREGGRWVRADDGSPDAGIPEGLREVIGKRLTRLSQHCNHVLSVAAVIGREFRLDVLQAVADLNEDELYAALEEATAVAVVEQRSALTTGVTFRFAHAFFRETLYQELFVPRRIRIHQQVGRTLEQVHARRLSEHAAEMAEHFAQSTDPADLEKALEYSRLGAERALNVFAFGEAARLYEQALQVHEVLSPDDGSGRCALLLLLAQGLLQAGDAERAVQEVLEEAFGIAEVSGDGVSGARSTDLAFDAVWQFGGTTTLGFGSPLAHTWSRRADQYAEPDSLSRVNADNFLAMIARQEGDDARAREMVLRGVALARKLGIEPQTYIWWLLLDGAVTPPEHHQERLEYLHELETLSWERATLRLQCEYYRCAADVWFSWGHREAGDQVWTNMAALAERSPDAQLALNPLSQAAWAALFDGRLEAVLEIADAIRARADELGRSAAGRQFAAILSRRPLMYLGRPEEALASVPEPPFLLFLGGVWAGQRASYLAHAGRISEANGLLSAFASARDLGSPDDPSSAVLLRFLLEAAVVARNSEIAALILPRMAPLGNIVHTEAWMPYCIGRLAGGAAALLDKVGEAYDLYHQGLEVCERLSFRPEIALCRLELAELLLGPKISDQLGSIGDGAFSLDQLQAEGQQHLIIATEMLREMQMTPFLERALRLRLREQGVDAATPSTSIDAVATFVASQPPDLRSHVAPDGTVTLLFTDIEGSTDLTLQLGDQRWLEVLRAHHDLVREQLQAHGGFEVKCQGDGFMLAFQSARRALECAVAIQRAVAASHIDPPIRVRMGLHTGEALKDADDFHGRDVVLAARIADQARGGEILVSALLKDLLAGRGDVQFDDGREEELKGLIGVQRMYAVAWT